MKRFLFALLVVLAIVCPCTLFAQDLDFELGCPAGSSPLMAGGKTFNASTQKWRANFCITPVTGHVICMADGCFGNGGAVLTGPTTTQIVNDSSAGGITFQNAACTVLNAASTLTDAGCGAVWRAFILRSIGSTQNNMRHGFNNYFETDLHQTGAGIEFHSMHTVASALLDSGSSGSASQRLIAFEPVVAVSDLASSGSVLGNVNILKARSIVGANAHVTNLTAFLNYLPTFGTGSVTTNFTGYAMDAPTGGGTIGTYIGAYLGTNLNSLAVTTEVGGFSYASSNPSTNAYGHLFTGKTAAIVADDSGVTPRDSSFIGHGVVGLNPTFPIVLHDGWYGGTGSPETVLAAKVGSMYSRQDGGSCTSFYVKESGSGNTGWTAQCPGGSGSAGTSGSITLAGGIIMQWALGPQRGNSEGVDTTNLPVTCPTAIDHVQLTYQKQSAGAASDDAWYQVDSTTLSSVDTYKQSTGGTSANSKPFVFVICH